MWLHRVRKWQAVLWLLAFLGPLAQAHPMPESRVWVDTRPEGLALLVQMPLNRLEFAFGQPLADDPAHVLSRHGDALARYLVSHVRVQDTDGGDHWTQTYPALKVVGTDGSAELEAEIEFHAPDAASARAPVLVFDAITHEVRTHRVQVYLRTDWAGGFVDRPPLLLGQLAHGQTQLTVSLAGEQAGASEWRLLGAGAQHIAQGTDHLLFLLMLLLVAPLAVQQGRWQAVRPWREAFAQTAWVVTAFAIGHSLTLVLGSTGWVNLPSQPVEVAVAATIAIAAIHALRPLAVRAERWMALGFGLVHGLAFSASLSGVGLTAGQHALALLSFNLGIELMQLALLALVMPALCLLAARRPTWYGHVRWALSISALGLAGVWVGQRLELLAVPSVADDAMGAAFHSLPVVLWGLALSQWRRGQAAPACAASDASAQLP